MHARYRGSTVKMRTPKKAFPKPESRPPRLDTMLDVLQQKSLELMKIVLHATLAGIFFKRGLLPLVTFGERTLFIPNTSSRSGSHIYSYEEFISGKKSSESDGHTFQVKVMERGVDSQTDQVLDLLEGSIFEVLVRRRLQAVKFSIIKKMEQPVEIVETYTIALNYQSEQYSNIDRSASKENHEMNAKTGGMNAPLRKSTSTGDVIKGIKQMDRLLVPFTTNLTKLPSTRALGVFLLYTEDCPDEYQAPNFIDASDFLFKFTSDEEQAVRKMSCGGISTGFHSASLRVTYLNPLSTSCHSSEAQLSPRSACLGKGG